MSSLLRPLKGYWPYGHISIIDDSADTLDLYQKKDAGLIARADNKAGRHPFVVLKTFSGKKNWVLGCICTSTSKLERDVPITNWISNGTKFQKEEDCPLCKACRWETGFRNARPLSFDEKSAMPKHTHVMFQNFIVLERKHVKDHWWNKKNSYRLSIRSMQWIFQTFQQEIKNRITSARDLQGTSEDQRSQDVYNSIMSWREVNAPVAGSSLLKRPFSANLKGVVALEVVPNKTLNLETNSHGIIENQIHASPTTISSNEAKETRERQKIEEIQPKCENGPPPSVWKTPWVKTAQDNSENKAPDTAAPTEKPSSDPKSRTPDKQRKK